MSFRQFDAMTETYTFQFYLQYYNQWPDMFLVCEDVDSGEIVGYVMGKVEGKEDNWHGHVTAISIDYKWRGHGYAGNLMRRFEEACDK